MRDSQIQDTIEKERGRPNNKKYEKNNELKQRLRMRRRENMRNPFNGFVRSKSVAEIQIPRIVYGHSDS